MEDGTSNGKHTAVSVNWKKLQKIIKEDSVASTSRETELRVEEDGGFISFSSKRKRKFTDGGLKFTSSSHENIWKKRRAEIEEATSGCSSKDKKEIELTKVVALDCEYVGTGLFGRGNMLARVSVVNSASDCLYDKYVKPTEHITDFRTEISGIRPAHLIDGESFQKVQSEVSKLLAGRIVVGHALQNDFKVLNMSHTRKLTRDTSKYLPLRELAKTKFPSLKLLAKEVLGIQIQQGEHSSVVDAQVAMKLYQFYKKKWENDIKKMGRY